MIQIDGLSRSTVERALERGAMPFLARMLGSEGHRLWPLYSGVPSTTPVVQGELFYGVRQAVPGFGFVDHESGQVVRMYEHEPARRVEATLARSPGLLSGGSAYCDIYTGGAADSRFCMSSMGWGDLFRSAHPLALPALAILHAPSLVRTAVLAVLEGARAAAPLLRGVREGRSLREELRFLSTRILICIVLRELVSVGAQVDVARGVPIVHLNLLGYDEYAHRLGPGSDEALASLRGIDRTIRTLVKAARRADRRWYDVWVYSDHGQEATDAYVARRGRSVHQAVAQVFRAHGIDVECSEGVERGIQGQRARLFGERLLRWLVPGMDPASRWRRAGDLVVAAEGPLGHVYAPRPLDPEERDTIAEGLVQEAAVPLVLTRLDGDRAVAWTGRGRFELPRDADAVLGSTHPYGSWAARDLVAVCHHPDAGDLVVSGWRVDGRPYSFPDERGSHAGPGPNETDAFAVLPPDAEVEPTPLPNATAEGADGSPAYCVLPDQLRRAALVVLGRAPRAARATVSAARPGRAAQTLRVMTYNVHSCVGLDGRLSPERIARVIALHDPDVVALQELDVGRQRSGGVDQAHSIAQALEMELQFHATVAVEEERFGDAILSRHPMRLVKREPLPRLARRSDLEPRGALWVELRVAGRRIQVINTHLSLHHRERGLQVEALLGPEWLGHPECQDVRVLCGDFNALPFFPVCRRLSSVLRDCQIGVADLRPRRTFPGSLPLGRIDHVYVDPGIEVRHVEVPTDSLARVASDHLPLVVDLAPGA